MKVILFTAALLLVTGNAYGATSCDDGWQLFGSNCYFFLADAMEWIEAQNVCASMREGADLAYIKSANTLRQVYGYILQYQIQGNFWLGASDIDAEGDWKWNDESRVEVGTPYWALKNEVLGWGEEPLGKEEQNCLALDAERKYHFDDQECANINHPICMYT